MAILVGTVASNNLVGTADADTITGLAGADTLRGAGGADHLDGGVGNDVIVVNTNDVVAGERLIGGNGTDILFADSSTNISAATQIIGIEYLLLDANITVTLSAAQVSAFGGIQTQGAFGWNLLAAGSGSFDFRTTTLDRLVGFVASAGADTILGGAGNEAFSGGAGADSIDAGDGNDRVVVNTNDVVAGERLAGGAGIDILYVDSNTNISTATQIVGFEYLLLDANVTATVSAAQIGAFGGIQTQGAFGWNLLAAGTGSFDFRTTVLDRLVGFVASAGADTILGGAGNEAFSGGAGADSIDAGDGNDRVVVNTNDVVAGERLAGGAGIDILYVDSNTNISGATQIVGFEYLLLDANVTVTVSAAQIGAFGSIQSQGAFGWNLLAAASGRFDFRTTTLDGSVGFVATAAADTIIGGGGDEAFYGGAGADSINAGDGNDRVMVNTNDVVAGERLVGGAGIDILFADSDVNIAAAAAITGFETLLLDANVSVALAASQVAAFRIIEAEGAFGWNLFAANTGTFDFRKTTLGGSIGFVGTTGADTIRGGAGDEAFRGGAGADSIDAGAGNDTVSLNTADVVGGERLVGGAGMDVLFADTDVNISAAAAITGFETLLLDANVSVALAASQVAAFRIIEAEGAFGWNLFAANTGTFDFRKTILGGSIGFVGSGGADTIRGGAGDEAFLGGAGADSIDAGAGNDTVALNTADVVAGERLAGGAGMDVLFADTNVNISAAAAITGFETLLLDANVSVALATSQVASFKIIDAEGAFGWNLLAANTGTFDFRRTVLDVSVGFVGSTGGDSILGGSASERFDGGAGADTINPGDGADTLLGGTGDDVFVLVAGQADGDRIADFAGAGAAGGDRLRFEGFGANASFAHVGGGLYEIRVGGVAVETFTLVAAGAVANNSDAVFV
ncbi:beta strand repeat-containing protein [Falsiroseomonas stagni]|uniref:Hemolysin-type calcium-binding repeat-containing protein n=1 Tax=Falsiroseomonas stagni DSM 19981 TaxID=1123062 RepID=A0A1I4D0F4_9PROT|nr:calcium-binding protein [Falsiroseomonas stagni]SFK87048.1 Hemolysin-type calcium-binding repeat-containing protein [Falsiroseomonas stagni DSM 19981]